MANIESLMSRNLAGLDNINGMSTPTGMGERTSGVTSLSTNNSGKAVNKKTDPLLQKDLPPPEAPDSGYSTMQTGLAGAKFMLEVVNAQSQYQTIKGQASLNIMQARNSAADALNRGRQAQSDAQSEGYQAGQESLLSAAAQGQDVNGAGAGKIQASYEAMGIYNGMREEINSMREALGLELEEINYDYQVGQADIQRTNSMIGSALSFGATAAYYKGKA